jgi:hypothetical protein
MRRCLSALVCALLLVPSLAPGAAIAKDTQLSVELDGRPLSHDPGAILHDGRAFVNVVGITKAFSGLAAFGRNDSTVRLTVRGKTADMTLGKTTGTVDRQPTTFPAAPFVLNGEMYVPLSTVAMLAGAKLSVDVKNHVARLTSAPSPAAT